MATKKKTASKETKKKAAVTVTKARKPAKARKATRTSGATLVGVLAAPDMPSTPLKAPVTRRVLTKDPGRDADCGAACGGG